MTEEEKEAIILETMSKMTKQFTIDKWVYNMAINDAIEVVRKHEFDGDWKKCTWPSTIEDQLQSLKK